MTFKPRMSLFPTHNMCLRPGIFLLLWYFGWQLKTFWDMMAKFIKDISFETYIRQLSIQNDGLREIKLRFLFSHQKYYFKNIRDIKSGHTKYVLFLCCCNFQISKNCFSDNLQHIWPTYQVKVVSSLKTCDCSFFKCLIIQVDTNVLCSCNT